MRGQAFKFGDNISTDHIAPGRLFHLRNDLVEFSKHVLEDADATFASRVQKGDFVVAGSNFGLGSSREHAALAPLYLGIKAVVVKSFARIHRSNLINAGILPLTFKNEAWCKGYDCGILKDICLKIPRNREGTFTKAGKSECNLRSIVCYIENRLFHLYLQNLHHHYKLLCNYFPLQRPNQDF